LEELHNIALRDPSAGEKRWDPYFNPHSPDPNADLRQVWYSRTGEEALIISNPSYARRVCNSSGSMEKCLSTSDKQQSIVSKDIRTSESC
jgi:hypothetical protein